MKQLTLAIVSCFLFSNNISAQMMNNVSTSASSRACPDINSGENQNYASVNFLNALTASDAEKKRKHYILRGILIGGAIGIAPVVFGQGGAYVAVFTFPAGLIIGAIAGAAAKRRHRND